MTLRSPSALYRVAARAATACHCVCAVTVASVASFSLFGGLQTARAANDAYSPDATSGLFSNSFTLGTTTPTAGGISSPASGDTLYFGAVTTGTATVNNDLTGFTFAGLIFNAGASAYTIGGNAFTLGANITNNSSSLQTLNNAITLGGNYSVTAGSVTFGGQLSGAQPFGNTGAGTVTVTNGAYTGNAYMNNAAGTYNLTATNAMTGGFYVDKGTMNLSGTPATTTTVNTFTIGTGGGAGRSVLNTTATLTRANMFVGDNGTNGGTVNQTGGTITLTQAAGVDNLRVGSNASGQGTYNLSGGNLNVVRASVGASLADTVGVMNVSGTGVLTTTERIDVAAGSATSSGLLNVTGGTVTVGTDIRFFTLAGGGSAAATQQAVLNVGGGAGAATVTTGNSATQGVNLAQAGNVAGQLGVVNLLANGTLQTSRVLGGGTNVANPTTHFNFNGGTLRANTTTAANGVIFADAQIDRINVYSGGGTINNNSQALTIDKVLMAPTGSGVYGTSNGNGTSTVAVPSGGAGYIGTPLVKITGGAGAGATGVATVVNGVVTGIVITSPGVGYASGDTLTATFLGGGSTTAATAVTISGSSLAANTSGGMTFAGSGTTTLSAANTYTGTTTVTGGMLLLAATGSLSSNNVIVLNAGTLTLNSTASLADTSLLSLANGTTLNLNAASGSETIGSLILNGNTVAAGTYTVADLNALNATYGTSVTFANGAGDIESLTVAVPEPSAWMAIVFAFGVFAFHQWRKRVGVSEPMA